MRQIIGIVLVALGVIGLLLGGFTYSKRQHDAEIGPIEIQHTERKTVPIPPVVAGILLAAGVVLLVAGRGRSPAVVVA